ncbi:ester cyclase [Tunturiibacter gelidoferens]|uniref:Steroid delta-isomerase-like uncharacterized protein n=2 Tax=Tunturiibacter TaxID=3154218 RepID=A0A7Y9NQP2_9BACT|nr:ester cyclase [Edaphobacter lichenicola]MBB5341212.1 steroid delta-isomerase-like uncharacterized protein [Edaphobacter lichenicola]NYF53779.1 steroid delta-isomerase-like uncharacterized protein [Edaphobacter lichenicola]
MATDDKQTMENKQIAQRFMEECWNQGKMDSIRELVASGCKLHDPVFPALTSGADNLKRHIEMCRIGFPDFRCSIDDTIAERNEVVHHWTTRGTHKGQFLGLAPTNRTATVSGTSIHRIEGGKIVEQWSDWNLMTLMEQLGLSAMPQQAESKTRA